MTRVCKKNSKEISHIDKIKRYNHMIMLYICTFYTAFIYMYMMYMYKFCGLLFRYHVTFPHVKAILCKAKIRMSLYQDIFRPTYLGIVLKSNDRYSANRNHPHLHRQMKMKITLFSNCFFILTKK